MVDVALLLNRRVLFFSLVLPDLSTRVQLFEEKMALRKIFALDSRVFADDFRVLGDDLFDVFVRVKVQVGSLDKLLRRVGNQQQDEHRGEVVPQPVAPHYHQVQLHNVKTDFVNGMLIFFFFLWGGSYLPWLVEIAIDHLRTSYADCLPVHVVSIEPHDHQLAVADEMNFEFGFVSQIIL